MGAAFHLLVMNFLVDLIISVKTDVNMLLNVSNTLFKRVLKSLNTKVHFFKDEFDCFTGRKFNKNGVRTGEWTARMEFEYVKRTECFVEQYGNFDLSEVDPTVSDSTFSNQIFAIEFLISYIMG